MKTKLHYIKWRKSFKVSNDLSLGVWLERPMEAGITEMHCEAAGQLTGGQALGFRGFPLSKDI